MRIIAIALLSAAFSLPAAAEEKPIDLKRAPGVEKVEANPHFSQC